MSALSHDIEAIIATATSNRDYLRIGVVEAVGKKPAISIKIKNDCKEHLRYVLDNLFEGVDKNGRIALVLTEKSPQKHGGAWATAANRFCTEKISGVFVLEKDQAMVDIDCTESFLARIPDVLWEAGMPIFYDESGILCNYATASYILEHNERLAFKDIEYLLEFEDLATIGEWAKGVFPVYDVTDTDEEFPYVKKISNYILDQTAGTCRIALGDVNCWRTSWRSGGDGEDIKSVILFLELAIPGSTDPTALDFLTNIKTPEEVPYAIEFDRASSKELDRLDRFGKNIIAVSKLISSTLKRYHVTFNPTYKDNLILSAEELHDLLEAFGISHQIKALQAGVPLEDIEV